MVAVFFDFNIIEIRIQVEGVVGRGGELAVDVDLGGGGIGASREEASPFDHSTARGAVSLGIADHEKSTKEDKENGREENE